MHKRLFLIPITLFVIFYISAFLNMPFAFIMSLWGLVYTAPVVFASVAIWWILPQKRKDKFVNNKFIYYLFVIITVLIITLAFLPGREVITAYYLVSTSMIVRVFFKIVLLMFILFIAGNFLKGKRIKTSIFCFAAYLVFVATGYLVPVFMNDSTKDEPSSNLKTLTTLPYLSWAPLDDNEDKLSVTIYDPAASCKGINKYTSLPTSEVLLFDMEGNILHKWFLGSENEYPWHYTKMLKNGDLIGLHESRHLLKKMDWDSNTIWELNLQCHHEITVTDEGTIYTLANRNQIIFIKGFPILIIDDYIAFVSADGKLLKEIPIFNSIKSMVSLKYVTKIYKYLVKPANMSYLIKRKIENKDMCERMSIFDIFHNNTITIAEKDIEGVCKKSDLLLSIRNFDIIAVLDTNSEEFVWTWGPGELDRQHHPTFLENGNILIFDNGPSRNYSRIIELDPITKQIVWEYVADPPENFFSPSMGSCQKLPNGNILIAEANKGRLFEITRQGKIAWEYYNPHIDMKQEKRASFYRAERIVKPEIRRNIEKLLSDRTQN